MIPFIDIHTHNPIGNLLDGEGIFLYNYILGQKERVPEVKLSIGIHPMNLNIDNWRQSFIHIANRYKNQFIAIGECGLDRRSMGNFDHQIQVFEFQIQMANEWGLPLIIHCVRAVEDCLRMLKHAKIPVIFHGVNQKFETVNKIVSAGHYVSFGHSLMKNETVQSTFKHIPIETIFLETDDSNLPISIIYKHAMELKGLSLEELKLQVFSNYKRVFNL